MDKRVSEHLKEGAESTMSEGEVAILRREINELSKKSDQQHAENRASQEKDRETFRTAIFTQQQTFATAMSEQRDAFQAALSQQLMAHTALDKVVLQHAMLLESAVGDGKPGEGRIGVLEAGMEVMKKFRWQALSVVSLMMWAVETWSHHGH